MNECLSSDQSPSNGVPNAKLPASGTSGAEETPLVTKPPLSPVSTHHPHVSRRTIGSSTLPRAPQSSSPIGAVASLAIGGGLSQEELLRIGQNRPPPVQNRSTRATTTATLTIGQSGHRPGGMRNATRRGHFTAPPGTVHIGRVTRVTRCDTCLSPPSSAIASFNASPRGSPIHLTRVGGIAGDTGGDRKSSLPLLPTDQLVRVGPGNTVSTRGQSYVRINLYPQPYKSASVETASNQAESAISSRFSFLSDTTESGDAGPVSPGGHSNGSDALVRNANLGPYSVKSTSEEEVHFFGSSFPSSVNTVPASTGLTTTTTSSSEVPQYPTPRSEWSYQQRLYHQQIQRSVRNLRRYRHIYGDSLNSVLALSKAPSSEERENPTGSAPTIQHRRSSADEALISLGESDRGGTISPSPATDQPSSSTGMSKPLSAVEQRRRRRHLFTSRRVVKSEYVQQEAEVFPMAHVIVALENDENAKPSKFLWIHRRCFVHNGFIFLTSPTEDIFSVIATKTKTSSGPPSLCEGRWCYSLTGCELSWSQVTPNDERLIERCGLLQSFKLHSEFCSLRVRDPEAVVLDYTCRLYFLQQTQQQDRNLESFFEELKRQSSEASGPQKSSSDINRPGNLVNLQQGSRGSLGVAGPPGGFPLMVAAETLAASFGVHMNRSQTGSIEGTSSRSPLSLKRAGLIHSRSGASSAPLQPPPTTTPPHEAAAPEPASTHHKSSLLRSTFARMRQVATGGGFTNSSTTVAPTSTTSASPGGGNATPSHSGFHQRLAHFSQTFTHDKSSPRRRKLDQIHRSYQSCQTTTASASDDSEPAASRPSESRERKQAHLHIPLTAVLEPSNSFLQSFSDEVPVNANELAVTMPMQLAVVDAAAAAAAEAAVIAAASGGNAVEPVGNATSTTEEPRTRLHLEGTQVEVRDDHRMPQFHHQPHANASDNPPGEQDASLSSSSSLYQTKDPNPLGMRRLLRRPTDPSVGVEGEAGSDLAESSGSHYEPPVLYSERSLVGSLPLHECARSTFSAFVPFVVELCVTLVEKFGLNCVGIYRVSGNKVAHDFMAAELCKQIGEIDATNEKWNDIHALACVLKTLLRNLPDTLIPKAMYPEFLAASRVESWERRLLSVQRLLSIMECYPKHPEYRVHRATLRYLATHLARVASRQSVNRMTAYNLALVFAPNLIQSMEESPELSFADSKFKIWLLETIIKYHKWVFSPDLGLESGCFVPEDSDQVLLTDEALAEAMAASDTSTQSGLQFANQPGRSEGDVRPILQEMLHAAALLPPPPSTSDLEVAEEPGPSRDKPTDVATVVEQALESTAAVEEAQQYQQMQRTRPHSQSGGDLRSRKQERSLSLGRRREDPKDKDNDSVGRRSQKKSSGTPETPILLITSPVSSTAERPNSPEDVRAEGALSPNLPDELAALQITAISEPVSPKVPPRTAHKLRRWKRAIQYSYRRRGNAFPHQRSNSGGDVAPDAHSALESVFMGAGNEISYIGCAMAFNRSKSYCLVEDEGDRSRMEGGGTPSREVRPSPQPAEVVEQPRVPLTPPPSPRGNTPVQTRQSSIRKFFFRQRGGKEEEVYANPCIK